MNYLCYKIWDYKGRPSGVHDDFGRLSFLNKTISPKYYCSQEEKAEIIVVMIGIINVITSSIRL
jgi:hypothetical protein